MGAAPNAPLVNVRTANANGESLTSDVIAAADWILTHKDQYNIKVVNFSMAGGTPTTFRFDPLDQAVEKLWFGGVTVVAAAGNFGTGNGGVDMSMAPGNDPFVITVGAVDQHQTGDPSDDTIPSWSAYGYSADGFSKPDLVAPGRYHDHAGRTGHDDPEHGARAHRGTGLHVDVRHVVLGSHRLGRRGSDPRAAPRLGPESR